MQREQVGVIFAYYNACWVKFDPHALALLLHDNVTFEYGEKTTGKQNVLDLFKEKFFNRVNIDSTVIKSFSVEESKALYSIVQDSKVLHLLEEFRIQDGLIESIKRTGY